MSKNISNIYVSIFGKSIQFWHLVYGWMIQPTRYVIFYNIIFNNNMIKISNIYVGTNGSLLQQIKIGQCRNNSQHYLLDHPNFKNNYYYEQEILLIFILSDVVYITRSLNLIYVKVIFNIQSYLSIIKTQFQEK